MGWGSVLRFRERQRGRDSTCLHMGVPDTELEAPRLARCPNQYSDREVGPIAHATRLERAPWRVTHTCPTHDCAPARSLTCGEPLDGSGSD